MKEVKIFGHVFNFVWGLFVGVCYGALLFLLAGTIIGMIWMILGAFGFVSWSAYDGLASFLQRLGIILICGGGLISAVFIGRQWKFPFSYVDDDDNWGGWNFPPGEGAEAL